MKAPFKLLDRYLLTAVNYNIPREMLTIVQLIRSALVILALVALVNALFSGSRSKS